MNGDYLYQAMGGIAPVYVDEAEKTHFSKPLWRTLLPMAACLAVIVGMYAGLQALMVPPALGTEAIVPSVVGPAQSPAAQTAAEYLRTPPWLNLGSLLLGLAAWGLPLAGLFRRDKRSLLSLASFAACALSLLLQVCNVLHRVNNGDFTTLADTMWFVILAAVVLVTGTVVFNLAVWITQRLRKK